MTVFRRADGPALAVAGMVLTAAAAFAQTPASGVTHPAASVTTPNAPAVETSTLGRPDGPPIGLLDPAQGGLGSDIWSGSPRATIEDLLGRIPLATPVSSVRILARRVLLTTADAPLGQALHAFQTVRIQALMNAGLLDDAAKLAAKAVIKDDPEFARVQAEAILLANDAADACGDATRTRLTDPDPFWMQLRAYCYGISGQTDMLDLTRGVMKAQGNADKPFEILLDDVLTHAADEPGELREPTAVEVFLQQQAGRPLDESLAAKFGLGASILVLRDTKNAPNIRADAAEQALHTGAIEADELDTIADAQTFTPDQLKDAVNAAGGLSFFLGQALLRQATAQATTDAEKTKLLLAALRLGEHAKLLPIAAAMQAKAIAAIGPDPALRDAVGPFARALLLSGLPDRAERWRESLDLDRAGDRQLAAALAVALDLAATNPGRAGRAQGALQWMAQNAASLKPDGGADASHLAAFAFALYGALDETIPPAIHVPPLLPMRGRELAPAILRKLAELRNAPQRKGEAILTILDAIGAQGPAALAPDGTVALVHALKAEGEPGAARALAVDALLLCHLVAMPAPTAAPATPPPPAAAP